MPVEMGNCGMDSNILQSVFPSFAVAFLGYAYSRFDTELDLKSVSDLIYYLFSPCLVFSSLVKKDFVFDEFFVLAGASVLIIFIMVPFAYAYMHAIGKRDPGFALPIIFMNTGNIALPMALFLYGNDGLTQAIIIHLVNVMILYSLGVFMVSRRSNLGQFFRIPFLYAGILGVFIASVPIEVPGEIFPFVQLVGKGIDIVGMGAIPLLIISLGYSLNRTRLDHVMHSLGGAGLRILLGPAIALAVIVFFRHMGWTGDGSHVTEAVILLMAAMPAPITSFLLNEKFDRCPEAAASMVLTGTVAAVVTIPTILMLSRNFIFAN